MNALVYVKGIDLSGNNAIVANIYVDPASPFYDNAVFIQDEAYTGAGVAVTPYGSVIYDGTSRNLSANTVLSAPPFISNGKKFTCSVPLFKMVGRFLALDDEITVDAVLEYAEEE